ncbi:glycosyltransferase [Posidoniimonas polymericola]|uniref:glycosyltransferase n=1 Tax=Posidoniimonas polymericola TaxID=2528002 RepID=UPI0018D30889
MGVEVQRYSVRDTREELIDPEDERESELTKILFRPRAMLAAALTVAATRPLAFISACRRIWGLRSSSNAGLTKHAAYLAEACLLLRDAERSGVEHLHAHFGTNPTTVLMYCRFLGGPTYSFTVHGPEEFDGPLLISLPAKIESAAFVVAISSFCRSQLQRWCGYGDWSKIRIVRCGLDRLFLEQPVQPILESDRFVTVARLAEQKGLMTLIEACDLLMQDGQDFSLRLLGDGPFRELLEAEISRRGLSDRIALLGWQPGSRVLAEIQRASCMVLPSFAEGLPVVLMEALANARPVIATQIAGVPELVRHHESGWLVAAGDPQALFTAMRDAAGSEPGRLDTLGLAGREIVQRQHDARQEAAVLKRALEAAIESEV